jgi:hypothetical protein
MEDINSEGHSPHKLHLLARRRQAEVSLTVADDHTGPLSWSLRTITQRNVLTTIAEAAGTAPTRSRARLLLAEKQDELEQLQSELRQRP